ncbi:hypothetical protein D3C76_882180 [compost metagenome]
MQVRAVAQSLGQGFDAVVGKHQGPQPQWQCGAADLFDLVALEADHLKLRALADAFGQMAKAVLRTEQHLELAQAAQVAGQVAQAVTGKVEHFQTVGQVEDFLRELFQPAGQVEAGNTCQTAGFEVFKGMHGDRGRLENKRRPSYRQDAT